MMSEYFRINQDVTFICQKKMCHANYPSNNSQFRNNKYMTSITQKIILKVSNAFMTETHSSV